MRIQELSVISGNISRAGFAGALPTERDTAGRWIAFIKPAALDDTKRYSSIGHCTGMRPDRVLRVGNRHYASPADETHSGLESDYTISVTGTNDAAGRFAAQRNSGKVGRSGRARAGAGTAWIAIERVRVVGLSAAT